MKTDETIKSENKNSEKAKFPEPCIMVIFGASGDLTKRMLIPALFELYSEKLLPKNFTVIGFSRKELEHYSFRKSMKEAVNDFGDAEKFPAGLWEEFEKDIFYLSAEYNDINSYKNLKNELDKFDRERDIKGNRLFYMAVPPDALPPIIESAVLPLSRQWMDT